MRLTFDTLRTYENYPQFLAACRELLADAANSFLESLQAGALLESTATSNVLEHDAAIVPGTVADDSEYKQLSECNQWVLEQQLPSGELGYSIVDPESNEVLAILDLAWPDGLQQGYSQPVTLLLDEGDNTEAVANRAGFRFFRDADAFRTYVRNEILAFGASEVSESNHSAAIA